MARPARPGRAGSVSKLRKSPAQAPLRHAAAALAMLRRSKEARSNPVGSRAGKRWGQTKLRKRLRVFASSLGGSEAGPPGEEQALGPRHCCS